MSRTFEIKQPTASLTHVATPRNYVGEKITLGYYGGAFVFPYIIAEIRDGRALLVPVIEKSEKVPGSECVTEWGGVGYLYKTRYFRADTGAEMERVCGA